MSRLNFDANDHVPESSFDLLPLDEYVAIIKNSELKITKSGNGEYLSLKLLIIDGPYKDRIIFDNLNIINDNSTAQNIAKARLSSICRAVNVMNIEDSSQLHNIPIGIKVGEKMDNYKGEKVNVIKKYLSASIGGNPVPINNHGGDKEDKKGTNSNSVESPPPWLKDDVPF